MYSVDGLKQIACNRFILFAADLSMNRPGFAVFDVRKNGETFEISDVSLSSVDNKAKESKNKSTGEKLYDIRKHIARTLDKNNYGVPIFFVREHAFNSRASQNEIKVFEVVGMTDIFLWEYFHKEWEEIYPVTIKKCITGNSKATKQEVESGLEKYVGKRQYANDDESDATAVGVTSLIKNGFIKQIGE